ncbi:MAG TPA: hypothetical protein VIC05_11340 [Solirubrobacteraceae bacterium]|jgi:hypothetical protein
MINVKAKPQGSMKTQRIQKKTSFQVLDRIGRGTKGTLYLDLPFAGTVTASGAEIKKAKVTVRKTGRASLPVELNAKAVSAVKRHGRIRAHIRLSYSPRGGLAVTKTVPLIFGYSR